jgi:opacity protein-like surface antigen
MKRWIVALIALMCASAVYADGLPNTYRPRSATIVPPQASDTTFNWTGLYVGGGVGYTWLNTNCGASPVELPYGPLPAFAVVRDDCAGSSDFFLGELKAGYDYRFGNGALLLGAFGTWSPQFLIGTGGIDNIYSLGGRAGLVFPDDLMLYLGAAWVRAEAFDTTSDGWAVLAGFEKPLVNHVTWGAEYKYTDFGDNFGVTSSTVMARINIKIN